MSGEIDKLIKILNDDERLKIYACIRELLTSGIVRERFTPADAFPTRQDVTYFILTWLKHIGVSADRCHDWIIRYSVQELSAISSSSPARIRHSTKSLIKYIFGSEKASFECGCEANRLRATCTSDCPVYGEMRTGHAQTKQRQEESAKFVRPLPSPDPQSMLQVKERYKEQFERAIQTIRWKHDQVRSQEEMVRYLNEQGFKTRTGKSWTIGTLNRELKIHNLRLSRIRARASHTKLRRSNRRKP